MKKHLFFYFWNMMMDYRFTGKRIEKIKIKPISLRERERERKRTGMDDGLA
jgi:hypothetical protein